MKKVSLDSLFSGVHFPVGRFIPDMRTLNWIQRIIKFLTYRRQFEILFDYFLFCPALGRYIFLPGKFIYDGASVPKFLYSLFSPTGMLLLGSGPHDFGYRYMGLFLLTIDGYIEFVPFSKPELDEIFQGLCILENHLPKASKAAKCTLTLFGFTGWLSARKENADLAKDFPEIEYIGKEIC